MAAADRPDPDRPDPDRPDPDRPDRPDPDRFAVCVFMASSHLDPAHTALARTVGRSIAEEGWRLVYGGGRVGLMGEVARAALDAGGAVTGIIPYQLNRREVAFDDVDDLVIVDTLAERKALMDRRSDAYVILPGGIGTLDEMLEVVTTRALAFHHKPVLLLDAEGYWAPWWALLEHMVDHGALRPGVAELMQGVADAAEMVGRLRAVAP